jgi:hypothetical protein
MTCYSIFDFNLKAPRLQFTFPYRLAGIPVLQNTAKKKSGSKTPLESNHWLLGVRHKIQKSGIIALFL